MRGNHCSSKIEVWQQSRYKRSGGEFRNPKAVKSSFISNHPKDKPSMLWIHMLWKKLKVTLSDRYDPTTQALNLGNFLTDEGLPLNQMSTTAAKRKVVVDYIPELSLLDVSNNVIYLNIFLNLVKAVPNESHTNKTGGEACV